MKSLFKHKGSLPEEERKHSLQPEGARLRIAAALQADLASVTVERHDLSPSQWNLRCRGTWRGKRIFSKTYLRDPYPVYPRFTLPWGEPQSACEHLHPAVSVMEKEWENTREFRKFTTPAIPAPLGKSARGKTIVWEEAPGVRVDRFVRRIWLSGKCRDEAAAALLQAGAWLSTVHHTSQQEEETIDLAQFVEALRRHGQQETVSSPAQTSRAFASIAESLRGVGPSVRAPVALGHGDFALSNLLWDASREHLQVIDFEHAGYRSILHDLGSMAYDLRICLLNPMIPSSVIRACEAAFWEAYGPLTPQIRAVVEAIVTFRILDYYLPRVSTRGERAGRWAGAMAALYQVFLQDRLVTRTLCAGWRA